MSKKKITIEQDGKKLTAEIDLDIIEKVKGADEEVFKTLNKEFDKSLKEEKVDTKQLLKEQNV